MTSGNFVGPRLGLLGDSFIYASGAVRSQVRRHSVTLACALTTQPLSVSVGDAVYRAEYDLDASVRGARP